MQTEANIPTQSADKLMSKLCRHFAHKVPATVTGSQGIIEFPFGRCRINAAPERIHFSVDVTDPTDVATAEQVITDHLLRMARGEPLDVKWIRSGQ